MATKRIAVEKRLNSLRKVQGFFPHLKIKKIGFRGLDSEMADSTLNDIPYPGTVDIDFGLQGRMSFGLQQLPGCCGIGLISQVDLPKTYRIEAFNAMVKICEQIGHQESWGLLMLTDREGGAMWASLKRDDWFAAQTFINPCTENHVSVFIREI